MISRNTIEFVLLLVLTIIGYLCPVDAFHVATPQSSSLSTRRQHPSGMSSIVLRMNADSWNTPSGGDSGGGSGGIETIEFKIYPDGRVEETVRGVKGNNCHAVTEKINESLGTVIASTPTEEMFEQPIQVTDTVNLSNGWDGSSSW